jgi:phosphoribosylamine-glycine ligase
MGTVAYFTKESKLGEETLNRLEGELVKLGHCSDVSLGFIIDEAGKPWPTEWTCRFGWPIANMMLGATKEDPVSWMKDALDGKDTTSFKEDIGVCVVIAHADFPYCKAGPEVAHGVPIYGVARGNAAHIHPQFVQIKRQPMMNREDKVVEKDGWATAGEYVAVVTGFGNSVQQANKRAYKTIGQLHVANMLVRDDIGELLEEQLPKLHAMGYATHCNFEVRK